MRTLFAVTLFWPPPCRSMLDDRENGLLQDILNSAPAIRRYLHGINATAFLAHEEKQDAVLRRLEIIGEAASRLAPGTQSHFSEMPFRSMRGMRNIIAHDYGEVDLNLVWHTASRELPDVVRDLESYFATLGGKE